MRRAYLQKEARSSVLKPERKEGIYSRAQSDKKQYSSTSRNLRRLRA
jgi:hypothetical protein